MSAKPGRRQRPTYFIVVMNMTHFVTNWVYMVYIFYGLHGINLLIISYLFYFFIKKTVYSVNHDFA